MKARMIRCPLIMNPRARGEKAQRARNFIMDNAARFVIYASNSLEDTEQLAQKFANDGEPLVVIAGGDGTLNAATKGLLGTDTAMAILPTGTMNVFARELGIAVDSLPKALKLIDTGAIKEIDIFEANKSPFIQMAGVGFDAQVVEETTWEAKKALGPLAYLISAVKVLGEKPPHLEVILDGKRRAEGVCVLAGNGAYYGGQFRLFGKAKNTDGLLDLLVFKEKGYRMVWDVVTGLSKGGVQQNEATMEYFQAHELTVRCDREVPLELDGDFAGRMKEAQFQLNPSKLKVFAPLEES